MEPYSIVCTTCQARLRVRDRSAIGQILACPKCGSMVMIQGPKGETVAPTPEPATSVAPTHETPGAATTPDTGPTTPSESGTPPDENDAAAGLRPTRTFKFREDFAPTAEPLTAKTPAGPRIPAPPKTSGRAATAPAPVSDAPPAAQATAHSAARLQQWLILGGAALAGVVLAVLLVAFIVSRFRTPPPSVAEAPTSPTDQPPPLDNAPNQPDNADLTRQGGALTPEPKPDADAEPKPDADAEPKPDADAEPKPDAEPNAAADNAEAPGPAAPQEPVGSSVPPPEVPADPPATDDAAPDATDVPMEPAEPADIQPEALAAPGWTVVIPALSFHDMPLISFANFVSDFANVPVSLDVDAMFVAQIALDTTLNLDEQQVTMDKVLPAVLEPVGLKHVIADQQVVITTLRDVTREVRRSAYDVSDLAGNDDQTQTLAKLVVTLIAPDSWADRGGGGTLTVTDQAFDIEQTEAGHFDVARFLDRLRAARGLLPRSELADERLDLSPAFVRAGNDLSSPVSANFPAPTDVARVVEYLGSEIDMNLIVDWPATAQANWLRSTQSTLSAEDLPLSKLLDNWLDPAQLGYRVLDRQTIQITSTAELERHPEIEIYPLKGDTEPNAAQIIQDLKVHLGPALFTDAGGSGEIVFEPESHALLVRLPQPQQRKAAEWLATADKLRIVTKADSE